MLPPALRPRSRSASCRPRLGSHRGHRARHRPRRVRVARAGAGRRPHAASRRRRPRRPRPRRERTAPTPKPESRPQTYTVKRGDTLRTIALDHGLDYRELAAWNNIENVNVIRVGQVLRVCAAERGVRRRARPACRRRRCERRRRVAGRRASRPPRPRPRRPPSPGARNTETYKTQPKAFKEPYSEQALRDVAARRRARRRASRPRRRRRRRSVDRTLPIRQPAAAPPPGRARRPQSLRRSPPDDDDKARLGVAGERQDRDRILRGDEPQGHRHRRVTPGSR